MGQYSPQGSLFYLTYADRRLALAESMVKCEGNLSHVAHDLGYSRSHMYRMIYKHKLWQVMKKIRIKRKLMEVRERSERN